MKKSNLIAMVLCVIGLLFLGVGMCMSLLPEWRMFKQGIVIGCIGLLIFIIMIIVYRKMENKASIKITRKTFFTIVVGVFGVLMLGVGMCLTMVFDKFILGIAIGIVGIILLLCLPPMIRGIR